MKSLDHPEGHPLVEEIEWPLLYHWLVNGTRKLTIKNFRPKGQDKISNLEDIPLTDTLPVASPISFKMSCFKLGLPCWTWTKGDCKIVEYKFESEVSITSEQLSFKLSSNPWAAVVLPVMYSCTATDIEGDTLSKAGARLFAIQWIWSSGVWIVRDDSEVIVE